MVKILPIVLPLNVIRALNIGKQSRAGALGVLIYDRFITFGLEVDYVWSQPKGSVGFFLYLFNAWLPLLWLLFDIIPFAPGGIGSPRLCTIYLMCDDIVTLVTTFTVQTILQLRVYAVYEKDRKMLFFLMAMCFIEIAIMASLIGVTISDIEKLPVISASTGCSYSGVLPLSSLFWTPALVVEPILCLLVLRKSWKFFTMGHSTAYLPALLARDSIMYFAVIFAELLASTVIWAHFPHYINVVMPWAAALPSLLGTRLLLNMRERILRNDVEMVMDRFDERVESAARTRDSPLPSSRGAKKYIIEMDNC